MKSPNNQIFMSKNSKENPKPYDEEHLSYLKGMQNYMLGAADSGDKKFHRELRLTIAHIEKKVKKSININGE